MNQYCYLVSNVNRKTRRDTLWKSLEIFGPIKQLHILNQGVNVAAVVIFCNKPLERLFLSSVKVEDQLLSVKEFPHSKYMEITSRPLSANKLSLGGLKLPTLFVEEWSANQDITLNADLKENFIDVFFAHLDGYYRFRINYNESVEDMLVLQRHKETSSLTISAKYPPFFWRSKVPAQALPNTYDLSFWERITEIPLDEISYDRIRQKSSVNGKLNDPISPNGEFPEDLIKLNLWTVYRLEFYIPLRSNRSPAIDSLSMFDNLSHEALENVVRAIKSTFSDSSLRQIKIPEIKLELPTKILDVQAQIESMTFEVQYMMEHAFNLKILRRYNVEDDFFEKMRALPPQVSHTFLSLMSAPQERVYNPDNILTHIYGLCRNQIAFQLPIPDDHFILRRVIVTPTSIYPLQPTVEPLNQLQYHFKSHANNFLYVEFTDEDLMPIKPTMDDEGNYNGNDEQNENLYNRIFSILRRGIRIAGKTYEFIGSSIKDLRSHSCWFFSSTDTLSRYMILDWMGSFEDTKTVANFTNYTGHFLMPRLATIHLNASEIEEIDDYIEYDYNFSQDCGKMSPNVAREIASLLNLNYTPSVVQFNLCGYQGILVVSNYLIGRKVQLRQSQYRFYSQNYTMFVSKYEKVNPVYLNWNSITLLSSLGIPYYSFENILEEEINSYEKPGLVFKNPKSYKLHCHHHLRTHLNYYKGILEYEPLAKSDVFISNLLISVDNRRLRELKEKCKIHVRSGARVYAAMDETDSLLSGEVFLQVTNFTSPSNSSRKVIEGTCVIFRESSCFGNDVRVVKAINCKKLHHLNNVLVYSNKDLRDLPSMCSNDDSNEDNFTVIWDHRLIPNNSIRTPRNYETTHSPSNLKKISFIESAKFFTTYVSKDILSQLREGFIAMSDSRPNGILNGDCSFLSTQMCYALDFAKTGIYASMSNQISQYGFPEFMKKSPIKSYPSKKPLGFLHQLLEPICYRPFVQNRCIYDQLLFVEGMERYIIEARNCKAKYDQSLRVLLAQYSIKSEIELISGYVTEWPKYINPLHYDDYIYRAQCAFSRLRDYWINIFYTELGLEDGINNKNVKKRDPTIMKSIEEKAAAWYYVTYHPSEFKSDVVYNMTLGRYLSFPWTVDNILISIAKKNANRKPSIKYVTAIPANKMAQNAKLGMGISNIIMDTSDEEESDSESEYNKEDADQNISDNNHKDIGDTEYEPPVLNIKLEDLL